MVTCRAELGPVLLSTIAGMYVACAPFAPNGPVEVSMPKRRPTIPAVSATAGRRRFDSYA
jgi:hypothetical protein